MSYPVSVRILCSLGLCALALLALPAAAGATVYCAPSPCSPGTPEATIADAVTAADTNAGPDTVSITAGTHNVGTGLQVGQADTDVARRRRRRRRSSPAIPSRSPTRATGRP